MSNDEARAIVKSDGGRQDSLPKFDLEFVNVNAISQAEKERNQRLIRSTAMKSFRRRQLSERSLKGEGSRKDSAKAKSRGSKSKKDPQSNEKVVSPVSCSDLSSESPFSEVSCLLGGSNDHKVDYFMLVNSNGSKCLRIRSSRAPSVFGNPLTPLGAGRVDPFRKLPADTGSHVSELIDYCRSQFYLVSFMSYC
jgi:hypothetical protein